MKQDDEEGDEEEVDGEEDGEEEEEEEGDDEEPVEVTHLPCVPLQGPGRCNRDIVFFVRMQQV